MLDKRQIRWIDVVQMLYKCFVFTGLDQCWSNAYTTIPSMLNGDGYIVILYYISISNQQTRDVYRSWFNVEPASQINNDIFDTDKSYLDIIYLNDLWMFISSLNVVSLK